MSYPAAHAYIDQFPKRLTEQFARSVTFIAGAITSVLAIASFLEPEHFLGFELLFGKSALFYIGVFAAAWAAARGMISEETTVFNPEYALRNVISFIHYMPAHWEARLHTAEVKREFSELYKLKVLILVEEIVGILTASLVLIFSAPKCSDQIIDFFREFTIHVDGVGYVCSFAVFDFKKGAERAKFQVATRDVRDDYYSTKHGKMAASYYGFLDNYVINPKTGIPGHIPPGSRHPFHPPPAFPGLQSPTLAAEMQSSRVGRYDLTRSRAPGGGMGQQNRTPRFGPSLTAPSPMASMLLDPHHQPASAGFGARSTHRSRGSRGGYQGGEIIEETTEDSLGMGEELDSQVQVEDEGFEGAGPLGESVWETSPPKGLSRENSTTTETGGQDAGVLGLIYQFQQAHRTDRQSGAL